MNFGVMVNIEAESAVVALMLRHGNKLDGVPNTVDETCFVNERMRVIWRAIESVRKARVPVDVVSVGSELHRVGMLNDGLGGIETIRALVVEYGAAPSTFEAQARTVVELAARRRLHETLAAAAERLQHDSDTSFIDQCEAVCKAILDIQRTDAGQKQRRRYSEIAQSVYTRLQLAHAPELDPALANKVRPIPTGIRSLDQIIGGLMGSKLYLVAGRPGLGKSAVCSAISMHLAESGHRCAVANLEMAGEEVFERSAVRRAGISWRRAMTDARVLPAMTQAIAECSELPIVVDDTPGLSIGQIAAWARAEKAGEGLRALFVDYAQLVAGESKRGGNREQEVASVSKGLKGLAKELDVPVVVAAQIGRTKERPVLTDLRESGQLEQDADVVVMLWTDDPDEDEVVDLELLVRKQRGGPKGTAQSTFNRALMRFEG